MKKQPICKNCGKPRGAHGHGRITPMKKCPGDNNTFWEYNGEKQ